MRSWLQTDSGPIFKKEKEDMILFNIFINNMGKGMEALFTKFAGDTKLRKATNSSEVKISIHSKVTLAVWRTGQKQTKRVST